jgi:hypothetical protein
MNQEMLCTWLGLPKTGWPPDACTLLGLPAGSHDLPTIEQRVQERMAKLRCYQISYPEEATEGMNRLAEAFLTLTELNGKAPAPDVPAKLPPPPPVRDAREETFISNKVDTKVDWRNEPPPVRGSTAVAAESPDAPDTPEVVEEHEASGQPILIARPFVAPTMPHRREIDWHLVRALATDSDEATTNLGTLEAVIARVESTRLLLHLWDKVGKHLHARPKKTSPKESELFAGRMAEIAKGMQEYPAILGQPGKPGYRVIVQARLKLPLATVRALGEDQRADLLFDWQAGRQVLLAHRRYLRQMFKSMRHRTAVGLVLHAVRAVLNDYPWLTLLGVALLAVVIGVVIVKWR